MFARLGSWGGVPFHNGMSMKRRDCMVRLASAKDFFHPVQRRALGSCGLNTVLFQRPSAFSFGYAQRVSFPLGFFFKIDYGLINAQIDWLKVAQVNIVQTRCTRQGHILAAGAKRATQVHIHTNERCALRFVNRDGKRYTDGQLYAF